MTQPNLPGRYEAPILLGEGSAGRVYRVTDSIRSRQVAMKLVTPSEAAWLRLEFETLRQIRHENLIQVFEWGALSSGEVFYTMELVEGGDWGRLLGTPQRPGEVRRILTGVLRGIAHLHCHGEVHGDLKPGNILLGAGGVVKIADVGMGGGDPIEARASGTPGYTAPEVWEGEKASVRSDLYSVGVMAYEALTGRHPFAGRTVRDVVSGQLEGWVPSAAALGVEVDPDMERAMMRAIERKPGLRMGSADEFMEAIGIADRIGEILSGRLVGRDKELSEIEGLLYSAKPGTPTLVYVSGEPGMGKATLMEAVGHDVISKGGSVLRLDSGPGSVPQEVLQQLISSRVTPMAQQKPPGPAITAEAMVDFSVETPLLVWTNLSPGTVESSVDWIRSLARCIWAVSLERGLPSRTLLGIASSLRMAKPLEPFEFRVQPAPFSRTQTLDCLEAVLGRTSLEIEFVDRIHLLTGGNPGATRACLAWLIDQRLIHRRSGVWGFREETQIQTLEMPLEANPWAITWDHLTSVEQRLLTALALVPGGLGKGTGESDVFGDSSRETLAGLEAKGWVRANNQRWQVFSEAIRQVVERRTTTEFRSPIAKRILSSDASSVSREDKVDLVLKYSPAPGVLDDGIWAAEEAIKRGDHRTALTRLRICLNIAAATGDRDRGRQISLTLADALYHLGDDVEAIRILSSDFPWTGSSRLRGALPRRAQLLGTIERSRGNLEGARAHFLETIQLAEGVGDATLLVQGHAGLAEIDWRLDSDAARSSAILRVRSILGSEAGKSAGPDERANLTYQLGAALILSGDFSDARRVLLDGLKHGCSDYWRMRLANAVASSDYYQGDFDSALKHVNQAWQYAESSGSDSFKTRILANRAGIYYGLGRPRDAVDQHVLAMSWARRIGSAFESLTACQGRAVNLILLARYEEALVAAAEARHFAEQIGDEGERAKALELESLAYFQIGEYEGAERLVVEAQSLLRGHGYSRVGPRLDWLRARLLIRRNEIAEAEGMLIRAEEVLLGTGDWEDLPGVQVELHLVRGQRDDPVVALRSIMDLMMKAGPRGAVVVHLYGAFAVAQIMLSFGIDDFESENFVSACLERADLAGMIESSWWLAYFLGEVAAKRGDMRHAQSRFTRALRVLREIGDGLRPEYRRLYLDRSHTRSALNRMATVI